MKSLMIILILSAMGQEKVLFDFNHESNFRQWLVVDDVVMGGRSEGGMMLTEEGHGHFTGVVSLENNGGFSSVRYRQSPESVKEHHAFVIRLKGDGKRYQFRVRSKNSTAHSYAAYFETTGEWQEVEIPFSSMFPTFRGMKLPIPNYPGRQVSEIGFLIGNKRAEQFSLEIDYIHAR